MGGPDDGGSQCVSRAERDRGKLSPSGRKTVLALMIIVGLISCITATVAYSLLAVVSSDLDTVLDNWESKPIIDLLVMNRTYPVSSCPDDYSSYAFPSFYGAIKGSCACTSNTMGYTSTYANCSESVESSAECSSDSALGASPNYYWRRRMLCVKTGGEAAYEFKTKKAGSEANKMQPWRRPNPDKDDGSCPDGYSKCGSGTYTLGRAICFPTGTACPYTSIKVAPYSSKANLEALGYSVVGNVSLDRDYVVWGRRGYINELPLVGGPTFMKSGLTSIGASDYISYAPSSNSRGICYDKDFTQGLPGQLSFPGTSSTSSWTYSLPNECTYGSTRQSRSDTRFNLVDHMDIESFLASNFETEAADCLQGGAALYGMTDSRYSTASDPDLYKSGVYSTSSSRSQYDAEWEAISPSAPACSPGDAICSSVLFQTQCGKWSHAAHAFSGESTTIGIYTANQIYWDYESCTPELRIYNTRDVLFSAVGSQLAVLVINWIAFLFACWQFKFKWALIDRVGPHDGSEVQRSQRCQQVDLLVLSAKTIPIFVSFVMLCILNNAWKTYHSSSCSDSMTNSTFAYLEEKIPAIWGSSFTTFVIDVCLLAEGCYQLVNAQRARLRERLNVFVDESGSEVYHALVPPRRKQSGGCFSARRMHVHCFDHDYDFAVPAGFVEGDHLFVYEDGSVVTRPRGSASREEWIVHCTKGASGTSPHYSSVPGDVQMSTLPHATMLDQPVAGATGLYSNLAEQATAAPVPLPAAAHPPSQQGPREQAAHVPIAVPGGPAHRSLEVDVQAGWRPGQVIKVVDPETKQTLDVQLPSDVHVGQKIRVPAPVVLQPQPQPHRFLEVQVVPGMVGGQRIMVLNPDTKQPLEVLLPAVIHPGDKLRVPF